MVNGGVVCGREVAGAQSEAKLSGVDINPDGAEGVSSVNGVVKCAENRLMDKNGGAAACMSGVGIG